MYLDDGYNLETYKEYESFRKQYCIEEVDECECWSCGDTLLCGEFRLDFATSIPGDSEEHNVWLCANCFETGGIIAAKWMLD